MLTRERKKKQQNIYKFTAKHPQLEQWMRNHVCVTTAIEKDQAKEKKKQQLFIENKRGIYILYQCRMKCTCMDKLCVCRLEYRSPSAEWEKNPQPHTETKEPQSISSDKTTREAICLSNCLCI